MKIASIMGARPQFIKCAAFSQPFFKNNPEQGWMAINPGSCGLPRDGDPRASCAILDTVDRHVDFHRVEYPVNVVAEQCRLVGLPERFCKSLGPGFQIAEN